MYFVFRNPMPYHSGNQMVDPNLLFEKAQLQPGMHVADFGCGRTGHIVFPASKAVGLAGIVYAIDVVKEVLEIIHKRAAASSIHNIQTVWTNLEWVGKTAIPPRSIDLVFMVNILDQSDNRHGILEEAVRLLKEKGRIVIVEWGKHGLTFGPNDQRFVDFQDIKRWSHMRGFVTQEEFEVGPFHRGMVLYKHD
jgi:ubiquinone/menaquinone biosynthesis C-methylase UbiE